MLSLEGQAKGQRVQAKAQFRPAKVMMMLMPAGSGKQDRVPDRSDFEGDTAGFEKYCVTVVEGAEGMLDASRSETTAKEHEDYMVQISQWSVRSGLGALVRKPTWKNNHQRPTSVGALLFARSALSPAQTPLTSWPCPTFPEILLEI